MQEPTEGLFGELDLFFDDLVISQNWDGKVKSSICKARKNWEVRRTSKVRRNDEGEAQSAWGGQMDFLRSHHSLGIRIP